MTHVIIAIEGINGIGKTAAVHDCRAHLLDDEHDYWFGHELEDGVGRQLHQMLRAGVVLAPPALALMFAAARIDSYAHRCSDQATGTILVYDRFLWSSLAYHSIGCDPSWVRGINQQGPRANFNILLDADPKQLVERDNRTKLPGTFSKKPDFLQQVRENFLELVEQNPGRSVMLDAMQSPGILAQQVANEIQSFLQRSG